MLKSQDSGGVIYKAQLGTDFRECAPGSRGTGFCSGHGCDRGTYVYMHTHIYRNTQKVVCVCIKLLFLRKSGGTCVGGWVGVCLSACVYAYVHAYVCIYIHTYAYTTCIEKAASVTTEVCMYVYVFYVNT
jgi:hypothetical protein